MQGNLWNWGIWRLRRGRWGASRTAALGGRRQREPWCLCTSRPAPALSIAKAYAVSFTRNEAFRDKRKMRSGCFLGWLCIQRVEQQERLLVVVAVASRLLSLWGRQAGGAGGNRRVRADTAEKRTHT